MGIGGIPIATAYSILYNRRLCLVREKQKEHATKKQIEGYSPTYQDKIVIIDDVFSVGTSIIETANILKTTGANIILGGVGGYKRLPCWDGFIFCNFH